MAGETGGAAVTLQPCEEQALRRDIEFISTVKKNLTSEQLVDLLCFAFPQSYARCNRKLLTERVAKATPLECGTEQAKKRRKIDEAPTASRQNEALSPSVHDDASEEDESSSSGYESEAFEDGSSNRATSGNLGKDSKEMNKDGKGGRKDVNGINRPSVRDLGGNDGRKDVNGINRPNVRVLGGSDGRREMNSNRPMFSDLRGMNRVISELIKEVIAPLHQWKVLRHLGIEPITRILLHGPPGCGKTTLVRAIANDETSAAQLVSGVSGAAEANIRKLFSTASMRSPSTVFIDEIDAMTSKMGSLWKRIGPCPVKQLISCIDKSVNHDAVSKRSNNRPGYVLVIGATNRPDALDLALRRQFDREIVIDAPYFYEREDMLSFLARNLKLEAGFDLLKLSRCTMGFVAGDLVNLVKKAGMSALDRIRYNRMQESYNKPRVGVQPEDRYWQPFRDEELDNLSITMEDFVVAAGMVRQLRPPSNVERFSTTPHTKWADVGGLQSLKLVFERHIVKHIKFPEVYKDLDLNSIISVFLYGPSGCGKALLVEALANEAGANFIHIRAFELVIFGDQRSWVLQNLFSYANANPPCILFFDELEVPNSCGDKGRALDVEQLLSEFGDTERGVYVIGATSRPEIVSHISSIRTDFDRVYYVPLPSPEERGAILKTLARNKPIDADVDLMALGKDVACENFSGHDLSVLMIKAGKAAIKRLTLFDGDCSVPLTIKHADCIENLPLSLIHASQELGCEKMNGLLLVASSEMEW